MRRPRYNLRQTGKLPPSAPLGLTVDERLEWAMATIDEEIVSSKGLYSPSGRGPTVQLVLWRAGFGPAFLEKKGRDARRDHIQGQRKEKIRIWLGKVVVQPSQYPPEPSVLVNPTDFERELRQTINDVELELVEAHARIESLERQIRESDDKTL